MSESIDIEHDGSIPIHLFENIPFSTLPLFVCSNRADYGDKISKFTRDCNKAYKEFRNSYEGYSFDGEVRLVLKYLKQFQLLNKNSLL